MPRKTPRADALALGHKHYYTGKVCSRGHAPKRYTASGGCVECANLRAFEQRDRDRDGYNKRARAYRQTPRAKAVDRIRNQRDAPHRKKQIAVRIALARMDPFTPSNSLLLARRMVHASKQRAASRGIPHTLTPEDLIPLPTHCPVFEMELSYDPGQSDRNSQASLDEILVGKGYVSGNVAIISMRANTLKSNMTREEAEKIYHYVKGDKP